MAQDSGSEEDFTLTHSEQVVIQFQSSDLNEETVVGDVHHLNHCTVCCILLATEKSLTMSSDACLPSIKVRGIAFGVRISYLEDKCNFLSVNV